MWCKVYCKCYTKINKVIFWCVEIKFVFRTVNTNALEKFFCMEIKTLIFSFSLNELNKVFSVKNFYIDKIHK